MCVCVCVCMCVCVCVCMCVFRLHVLKQKCCYMNIAHNVHLLSVVLKSPMDNDTIGSYGAPDVCGLLECNPCMCSTTRTPESIV